MIKEFIPYEQALVLKELGFDEYCLTSYLNGNLQTEPSEIFWFQHSYRSHKKQEFISAPTYSQTFRWFREKYNLPSHIHTIWQHDWNNYSYQWHITEDKEEWNCIEHFKTYEEAELACLNKLIEIVKSK